MSWEDVLCKGILLEILSILPVKSLIRFMCMSKYFQSLILDPCLATMHLQNSCKSPNFLLKYYSNEYKNCWEVVPSRINSSLFVVNMIRGNKLKCNYQILGSCNGLVCLTERNNKGPNTFHLWNPTTKKELMYPYSTLKHPKEEILIMLGYGYDNSRHSYRVVAIFGHVISRVGPFRSLICSLDEKRGWREIQDFPAQPPWTMVGIYLNNTLNWLGAPKSIGRDLLNPRISFDELVIVSLDLETETYTQLLLPHELNGVVVGDICFIEGLHSNEAPLVGVLNGYLSLFIHNRKTKHLSIWQMKEFRNQRSWTLLLNIFLLDFGINDMQYDFLILLCMTEKDRHIVIVKYLINIDRVNQIIIYNMRDKRVSFRNMVKNLCWIHPIEHVQSLVSPDVFSQP